MMMSRSIKKWHLFKKKNLKKCLSTFFVTQKCLLCTSIKIILLIIIIRAFFRRIIIMINEVNDLYKYL